MREFDPEAGYGVFVRTVCGLAAGICLLLLAVNWFQTGIANFYHPASPNRQDFQLIGGLLAGFFWRVTSSVSGRFAWFVISRRPAIDHGIFAGWVVFDLAFYFVRQGSFRTPWAVIKFPDNNTCTEAAGSA